MFNCITDICKRCWLYVKNGSCNDEETQKLTDESVEVSFNQIYK